MAAWGGSIEGRGTGSAALAAALAVGLACSSPPPPPQPEERPPPPAPPATGAGFSSEAAFGHLEALVALGPRPPGSEAARQARTLIAERLAAVGLTVRELAPPAPAPDAAATEPEENAAATEPEEDAATTEPEENGKEMEQDAPEAAQAISDEVDADPAPDPDPAAAHVLLTEIPGASPDLIVLAAPYDSQHFESFRFVGANEGASGTALLLELARAIAADPLPYTVWVAFVEGDRPQHPDEMGAAALHGSRLLVETLSREGRLPQVRLAVHFDRVADRDLAIARDLRSHRQYRMRFFDAARRLGFADRFPGEAPFEMPVTGHLAFWQAGMRRVVALADERLGAGDPPGADARSERDDLPACCAAESLDAVGQVSLAALRDISATLARIDRFARRPEPVPDPEPPPAAAPIPRGAEVNPETENGL